jgi:transcriptional regulator
VRPEPECNDGLAGNRGADLNMYNPPHFLISDATWIHAFIRRNPFATIAAAFDGAVHFAYVPVVLDQEPARFGTVFFHLARSNPIAALPDGSAVKMSIMGSHTYVSPDWYETPDQVPTWNYMAVEGSGRVRRLDEAESLAHLTRLADEQESALAPKPPWSPTRLPPQRLKQLLLGIVPFRLVFEALEGKAKLSQNRSQEDVRRVIAALTQRGGEAATAVASSMQDLSLR